MYVKHPHNHHLGTGPVHLPSFLPSVPWMAVSPDPHPIVTSVCKWDPVVLHCFL